MNELLYQFCMLKNIPFNTLNNKEKLLLVDTLGFQAFILYVELQKLRKEFKKEIIKALKLEKIFKCY